MGRVFSFATVALLWGAVLCAQDAPGPGGVVPEGPAAEEAAAEGTFDALDEYARIAAGFVVEDDQDLEIRFHQCQHVTGQTLVRVLESFLTPGGTVAGSDESDIVVISDVEDNIALLENIAEHIDRPVPQVLVEARIVEFGVDTEFQKEVNIEMQTLQEVADLPDVPGRYTDFVQRLTDAFVDPGSNPLNTRGSLSYMRWSPEEETLLTGFIRLLETRGRSEILSAPNLILRRGAEGTIISGEEVPISTQTITSGSVSTSTTFKSVGIKLRVTPVMIDRNRVRLSVNPEVSNVARYDDSTGAPIIAVRNAQTELMMEDGQLVTIGGLLRSEELDRRRRVPFLASVPVLGHLFRGSSKDVVRTHLVIFLRVRVLPFEMDDLPALRTLELPEDVERELEEGRRSMEPPATGLKEDMSRILNDGETARER